MIPYAFQYYNFVNQILHLLSISKVLNVLFDHVPLIIIRRIVIALFECLHDLLHYLTEIRSSNFNSDLFPTLLQLVLIRLQIRCLLIISQCGRYSQLKLSRLILDQPRIEWWYLVLLTELIDLLGILRRDVARVVRSGALAVPESQDPVRVFLRVDLPVDVVPDWLDDISVSLVTLGSFENSLEVLLLELRHELGVSESTIIPAVLEHGCWVCKKLLVVEVLIDLLFQRGKGLLGVEEF